MVVDIFLILWAFLVCIYVLNNIRFFLIKKSPETILDFLMSDEDLVEYEKAKRELDDEEKNLSDLEYLDAYLKQISKQARRNKDGSFDRRSENGRLLNQQLPVMPKKISEAKNQVRVKQRRLNKYLYLYDYQKSSWTFYHSFNFAFHRSFWTAILFVYAYQQSGFEPARFFVWFSVLIFLILKIWFSKQLHDLIKLEEENII